MLGTAIGTKFALTYASIFMDKISGAHPIALIRFTDDVFFI